jgi:hypothetical protein
MMCIGVVYRGIIMIPWVSPAKVSRKEDAMPLDK